MKSSLRCLTIIGIILMLLFLVVLTGCGGGTDNPITEAETETETDNGEGTVDTPEEPEDTTKEITVTFDFSSEINPTSYTNIYVIWLENVEGEIQHIYVCQRLLPGADTTITDRDSALPFWHLNRYDASNSDIVADVDAVTGATERNTDFTVSAVIDDRMGDQFTIYFEIDQAFQFNDFFTGSPYQITDQPAVLYSADVDLGSSTTEYTLNPLGFSPMYEYSVYEPTLNLTTADQDAVDDGSLIFDEGVLFEEIRYITHALATDEGVATFGSEDPTNSAIRSVASITATVSEVD
jgi:hypothetical protein